MNEYSRVIVFSGIYPKHFKNPVVFKKTKLYPPPNEILTPKSYPTPKTLKSSIFVIVFKIGDIHIICKNEFEL